MDYRIGTKENHIHIGYGRKLTSRGYFYPKNKSLNWKTLESRLFQIAFEG
jgi:hypothetical protein